MANILQSARHESLYPQLQPDFRIQKVNDISADLNKKVEHYRKVAKKYKHAKKVVNWSAGGSSVLSAVFSSTSFGSALSIVGLAATIPLGSLGGGFALASSGLIIASKKLDSKIKNIKRLSHWPLRNATQLIGFFLKPLQTIRYPTASFS